MFSAIGWQTRQASASMNFVGSRGNDFATLFERREIRSGLAMQSGTRLGWRRWRARLQFLLGAARWGAEWGAEVEALADGGFGGKDWREVKWGSGIRSDGSALLVSV